MAALHATDVGAIEIAGMGQALLRPTARNAQRPQVVTQYTPEVIAGWQRLWGLGFCGHPYRVPVCYVLIYGVCLTYVN